MKTKKTKKVTTQYLKAYSEKAEGDIVAVASDETVDRQGDSLPIDKWDLGNYQKNPVIQFGHDYGAFPIGKAKRVWVENSQLKFIPEFHNITEQAKQATKLVKAGFLNAWSVGFMPHMELAEEGNEEQLKALELLEISLVPVPANPSALVEARAKGFKIDKIEKMFKGTKKVVKKSEEEDEKDDGCGCGKKKIVKKEVKKVEKKKVEKKKKPKKEKIKKPVKKEGRIISAKNRKKIKSTLSSLTESTKMLKELMEVSEPKEKKKAVKKIKKSKKLDKPQVATAKKEQKPKIKTVATKSRMPKVISDDEILNLALKQIARNVSFALNRMNKDTGSKQG